MQVPCLSVGTRREGKRKVQGAAAAGWVSDMSQSYRIADAPSVQQLAVKLRTHVDAGYPMKVTVERWKKKRSVDQNARMWAILNALSKSAPPYMDGQWYSPDVWHEYMKRRFLGVEPGPFGEPATKSTAKLSTVEFSGYCDQIEAWIAEEGIILENDNA